MFDFIISPGRRQQGSAKLTPHAVSLYAYITEENLVITEMKKNNTFNVHLKGQTLNETQYIIIKTLFLSSIVDTASKIFHTAYKSV